MRNVIRLGSILLTLLALGFLGKARAEFVWPYQAGVCLQVPGFHYTENLDSDNDGLKDWQEDLNEDCNLDDNETDRTNKDTDGDGIWDRYEIRDADTGEYRCPKANNPRDCDGDGKNNGNDTDADGDGILDQEENCSGDKEGRLAPKTQFHSACMETDRFKTNPYLWQETSPYSVNSDGDGLSDDVDLCPRDTKGGDPEGPFACVRSLCRTSPVRIMNRIASDQPNLDTDRDGRFDVEEDQDKDCQVDRQQVSLESDPYNPNSDYQPASKGKPEINDYKLDGDDECPLDGNLACKGVCIPGGGAINAVTGASVDRGITDYDLDGVKDAAEDVNGDCEYNGPEEGLPISRETHWKLADTDGDATQQFILGRDNLGVGSDLYDKCPHLNPTGKGADETFAYPKCLFYYCTADLPDRLRVTLDTISPDVDGDNFLNKDEDPSGNCRQGLSPLELDPLDPDTDGDGVDDGSDPCPHLANETNCPDLCPEGQPNHPLWSVLDSDNDGLKNSEEDANGDCERGVYESDPFLADTDGDGMNDYSDACAWDEDPSCLQVCDPDTFDADADSDGDGLKNGEEDADKNCIYFGVDVASGGTSLMAQPFDTSPYLRDSDGDGISDRVDGCQESPADAGIAPDLMVPVSVDETDCARNQCLEAQGRKPGDLKDSDRDGIPDLKEDLDYDCIVSIDPNSQVGETDRFNPDTDGDGILDGVEDKDRDGVVDEGETNPRAPDTDSDGIADGVEDRNHNGKVDFGESDPKKPDSDGDTIPDNIEDRNLNGLWDGGQTATTGPCVPDGSPETSAYLTDSDLDNQPDNIEDLNKNGIFTNIGFDGDFSSASEFGETHPCNADTDGDGLFDGQEDKNHNGVLDLKEGETSPISPSTFGEPDMNRAERRVGIGGCSLIP